MSKITSFLLLTVFFFALLNGINFKIQSKNSITSGSTDLPSFICDESEAVESEVGPDLNFTLIPDYSLLALASLQLLEDHIAQYHQHLLISYTKALIYTSTDLPPPAVI
ncbi:MAG: hypothetical protein ACOYL6_06535 [Bacteriovoracaceae bacterium]